MTRIKRSFYLNNNTLEVAENLLGKVLVSNIDGKYTSGIISETEAYLGIQDKASHAFGGRRSQRTETMYLPGGHAYVYLCYGIHHLFNVVTGGKEDPQAVLIRNIFPLDGLDIMLVRRGRNTTKKLSTGPGTTSQALGITTYLDGVSLLGKQIWIEDRGIQIDKKKIQISRRIGVDYAEEAADLPYRFLLRQ